MLTVTIASTSTTNVKAADTETSKSVTILENGDYIETTITTEPVYRKPNRAIKSTTKTKTLAYKEKSGKTLWSFSITGTFTYNGVTAKCTSCSHSSQNFAPQLWKIKSITSSKSGNSATAKVTAECKSVVSMEYHKTATITCDKNGTVS